MFSNNILAGALVCCLALASFGQSSLDKVVVIDVNINPSIPAIQLYWSVAPGTTQQVLYKKKKIETTWETVITLNSDTEQYIDTDISLSNEYEYRIYSNTGSITANGYTSTGYELSANRMSERGGCLVLVDDFFLPELETQITQTILDIKADGWAVYRMDISRNESDKAIKQRIQTLYFDPITALKTVFILGHIRVPYSGNIGPDGHSNHIGAWPADVYYADIDNGGWSDFSVNNSSASRNQNKNIAGDGKWDASRIPSAVELALGRVDFYDMPAFSEDETELMRRYLQKLHAYKTSGIPLEQGGLIDDNFGYFGGEAFGQNGWRNFSSFFSFDSIRSKLRDGADFFNVLQSRSLIWAYGCGGGSYTSAGGIGNTVQFDSIEVKNIFTMLFGSYFGDWDSKNNLLRAPLASGTALTNAWAGRPNWFMHHMAMGETIGFSTKLTQNNNGSVYSPINFGGQSIHIALMGDPTLRMYMMEPPRDLIIEDLRTGSAHLSWRPSRDTAILGYHIYRSFKGQQLFEQLNGEIPVPDTTFIDTVQAAFLEYEYMVRAVKLEEAKGGSFYNLSLGATNGAFITTGSEYFTKQATLELFPNPVTDKLYLHISNAYPRRKIPWAIHAISGTTIRKGMLFADHPYIETKYLPAGIYTIKLYLNREGPITSRFIKIHP